MLYPRGISTGLVVGNSYLPICDSDFVSDFQGPSTRYCIYHTSFSLCRRGKIWFSGGVVGYSFLCCGVSGWVFLLFTVHVYSED